ncbi:P-type ATPase, subfamily IV, partial [Kipferlia bialata]
FQRVSNIFFMFVVLINLIPELVVVTPITVILPLVFIFFMAAVREGLDDSRRRKADKQANLSEYDIIRCGVCMRVASEKIRSVLVAFYVYM